MLPCRQCFRLAYLGPSFISFGVRMYAELDGARYPSYAEAME